MGFRDLSLRWKLLIPFLLLSFAGTTSLVWIAFHSQHKLIYLNERRILEGLYKQFLQGIEEKTRQALSLAVAIANDPQVERSFAKRDREALLSHLLPIYDRLRKEFGIRQIHFHTPGAVSFLRVHLPSQFGEEMASYRPTILKAIEKGGGVGGLEWGNTGYSIRGVTPVAFQGKVVGTVEVGYSFGNPFIRAFKSRYGCDLTLYVKDPKDERRILALASTLSEPPSRSLRDFDRFQGQRTPLLWMPYPDEDEVSGLLGPVSDFSGRVVALVELRISRAPVLPLIRRSRRAMALVEIIALILATGVVWLVVQRFLTPIREMARGAAEIVSGDRLHMPVRGRDEIGQLARALNNMVGYLEASRQRMRDYAQDLEKEVQKRLQELRQSEEKYRILVDRVPLVVYQMTPQRRITFVNQFVKELLGVEPQELISRIGELDPYIHPEDRDRVKEGFLQSLAQAREWMAEYRMEHTQGRIVYVREHALPRTDEKGTIVQVDGILVDITSEKSLQEKTLLAEELRTLGEISARLAHEIRNPLTSIGGLTRRLQKELPKDHPAQKWVRVVVGQVQRLEQILQMILAYIQPLEIRTVPGDPGAMLEALLEDLRPEFRQRGLDLSWRIQDGLPPVLMDPSMLRRALETLCRHTLFYMDRGQTLWVQARRENEWVRIRLEYPSSTLTSEDLEHYFYPFLSQGVPDPSLLDLPISKIILYKHGGLVHVRRLEPNRIRLDLALPPAPADESPRPPEAL